MDYGLHSIPTTLFGTFKPDVAKREKHTEPQIKKIKNENQAPKPDFRKYRTIEGSVKIPLRHTFSSIKSISIQKMQTFTDGHGQTAGDSLVLTIGGNNGEQNQFLIYIDEMRSELSLINQAATGTAIKDHLHFEHIFHSLSLREQEVLTEVAEGHTSTEISQKLFISTNTVKNHRKNIRKKLNIKDKNIFTRFINWTLKYCA